MTVHQNENSCQTTPSNSFEDLLDLFDIRLVNLISNIYKVYPMQIPHYIPKISFDHVKTYVKILA